MTYNETITRDGNAAGRVTAYLDNRIRSTFHGPAEPETIASYPVDGDNCSIVYVLTVSDVRAVLAENASLRQERIDAHDKAARFTKLAAIVGEGAARADVYGEDGEH